MVKSKYISDIQEMCVNKNWEIFLKETNAHKCEYVHTNAYIHKSICKYVSKYRIKSFKLFNGTGQAQKSRVCHNLMTQIFVDFESKTND